MPDHSLRGDRRSTQRSAGWLWAPRTWLMWASLGAGFSVGLVVTLLRDTLLPRQYQLDALKIWNIAAGNRPGFTDQSFTPVANVYRALGMADAPTAAALFGFFAATIVIVLAVFRSGRRGLSWPVALFAFAAFMLSAIYLGQYSKDVFVLTVAAALLLPRHLWGDLVALATMCAYAYFFRDYWGIVAVGFCLYRVLTIRQVRVRYLLLIGSACAVLVGSAFAVFLGLDPNHYRTSVQSYLEANTFIHSIEPVAQPFGGMVDVFVNYWLVQAPVTLPFTAGPLYVVAALALAYVRLFPLYLARGTTRWPENSTLDGVLVRRSLALLISFAATQALFEPDYGSVLRHLTPLLPLGIVVAQAMRASRPSSPMGSALRSWNWTGGAARI